MVAPPRVVQGRQALRRCAVVVLSLAVLLLCSCYLSADGKTAVLLLAAKEAERAARPPRISSSVARAHRGLVMPPLPSLFTLFPPRRLLGPHIYVCTLPGCLTLLFTAVAIVKRKVPPPTRAPPPPRRIVRTPGRVGTSAAHAPAREGMKICIAIRKRPTNAKEVRSEECLLEGCLPALPARLPACAREV